MAPSPSSRPLADEVVVVTGASKGIGRAIAQRLAHEGTRLVLVARTESALQALASQLVQDNPGLPTPRVEVADLSDIAQCEALIRRVEAACGRIDVLVNNAGISGKISLLQEVSLDDLQRTIQTNLTAPLALMTCVLPGMVAREHGTILNINSVAGKTAYPYWSVYCASKFGLHAATEAVAEEQRSNGIRVLGLYPGAVDTPIWDGIEVSADRTGMLSAETVADAAAFMLTQPAGAFAPELVLKPLQSVV